MSDYKMVPVVATEDMVAGARWLANCPVRDAVNAAIAAAPPFVVTDEMVHRARKAYFDYSWNMKKSPVENDLHAMRAAIEAVLGGGG